MGKLFELAPLAAPLVGVALIWKYHAHLTKRVIWLSLTGALLMLLAIGIGFIGEIESYSHDAAQKSYAEILTACRTFVLFGAWILLGTAALTGRGK